jgi:hypothetical protein
MQSARSVELRSVLSRRMTRSDQILSRVQLWSGRPRSNKSQPGMHAPHRKSILRMMSIPHLAERDAYIDVAEFLGNHGK